ncbi:murein transglycosylase A [Rhizosaccharibacter radicis]|uniref:peptidoglycan lytic exotransglycosylase n=1 Tax=Rhizosaccharibacter radicis TaxID=2782605 RepID=A0ABT1VVR2_9PROT|nr:murein transglycosylase A [Acetobacteraceae bacterium KSS12]
MAAALAGCASPSGPPELSLRAVAWSDLAGWQTDRTAEALRVLLVECNRLGTLPADTSLGGAGDAATQAGRAGLFRGACRAARAVPSADDGAARRYFETWFLPYRVGDRGDASASFTAYFEPEVAGALGPSAAFPVPVYGRPDDLLTVRAADGSKVSGRRQGNAIVPYWSRADIDRGALRGRGLEILWLRSPVDLFFLQLQGSGRVRLPSGQVVRLGYNGRNGQPYVPLGRLLVQRGALPADGVSMQSIRAWLQTHPADAQALMEQNPNYVFFKPLDSVGPLDGPPGALGVDLVPLRSAAVDRAFLPLGVPVFVDTVLPSAAPLQRLFLAQDLGTDIKGPARADLFLGWGSRAAADAGAMHGGGTITVLLPRQPAAAPAAPAPAVERPWQEVR